MLISPVIDYDTGGHPPTSPVRRPLSLNGEAHYEELMNPVFALFSNKPLTGQQSLGLEFLQQALSHQPSANNLAF
jgi:hypothetical protein